jgi:6-pyruvoyltetrahydropterin/6-carboxytetrahydropterin synthase
MAGIDYTDARRMRLDVEFYFAAAHRLPRYEGPCFRMHGHNYKFFVALEGDVDPRTGMTADFGEVKRIVHEHVLSRVDHRTLNDLLENPTAENIARWIWEVLEPHLAGLVEVRLYEIPDSCVTYRGARDAGAPATGRGSHAR